MSYVSSGQFRADLAEVTGIAVPQDNVSQRKELAEFEPALRAELEALHALTGERTAPKLCVLEWGDFYTVPELTGEERDEVLNDWLDGDEKATDFVMRAIDILNGGGGFYLLVDTDGRMGLLCEDPHSLDTLDCTLEQLLRALVAAHRAARTQGLAAAQAELEKAVDEGTAKLMLTFAERLTPGKS